MTIETIETRVATSEKFRGGQSHFWHDYDVTDVQSTMMGLCDFFAMISLPTLEEDTFS